MEGTCGPLFFFPPGVFFGGLKFGIPFRLATSASSARFGVRCRVTTTPLRLMDFFLPEWLLSSFPWLDADSHPPNTGSYHTSFHPKIRQIVLAPVFSCAVARSRLSQEIKQVFLSLPLGPGVDSSSFTHLIFLLLAYGYFFSFS